MLQSQNLFDAFKQPNLLTSALGNSNNASPKPPPINSPPPTTAEKENKKLTNLVKKSDRILVQAQAVFPFDLFPDSIVVDENKVDLICRTFFFTKEIYTIMIKNINYVSIFSNIFFASLQFEVVGYEQNPPNIKYLWRWEATRVRDIILGLVACNKDNIDSSFFGKSDFIGKVKKIGETSS